MAIRPLTFLNKVIISLAAGSTQDYPSYEFLLSFGALVYLILDSLVCPVSD